MCRADPVRVLMVASIDRFAGAERQLFLLARAMVERGVLVTCVFLFGQRRLLEPFEHAGITCHLYEEVLRSRLHRLRWLRDLIRYERPDVIHAHMFSAGVYGRIAARAAGVRQVIVSELSGPAGLTVSQHALNRLLGRWTTAIIANSNAGRRFHVDVRGMAPDRVVMIPNGFDAERYSDDYLAAASSRLGEKLGMSRGDGVVGMIANFSHWKNHCMLVDAVALLKRRGLPCRLVLAGDGPLLAHVTRYVADKDLMSDVCFVGQVADAREVLGLVDVFALASRVEGMSNAVMEACASAIPCVVTDVGGNSEIVADGDNGFVVPPDDAGAMADRIAYLLTHRAEARAMGARGRERMLRDHTIAAMTDAHMIQYRRFMKA